jgi:hypothetical protein
MVTERKVEDKTILDNFAEDFCRVIEKYVKYIICSGFVAIAHGRARGTEDIDMIIERVGKEEFFKIHDDLIKNGFVSIQSDSAETLYDDYLNGGESVRYV